MWFLVGSSLSRVPMAATARDLGLTSSLTVNAAAGTEVTQGRVRGEGDVTSLLGRASLGVSGVKSHKAPLLS